MSKHDRWGLGAIALGLVLAVAGQAVLTLAVAAALILAGLVLCVFLPASDQVSERTLANLNEGEESQ